MIPFYNLHCSLSLLIHGDEALRSPAFPCHFTGTPMLTDPYLSCSMYPGSSESAEGRARKRPRQEDVAIAASYAGKSRRAREAGKSFTAGLEGTGAHILAACIHVYSASALASPAPTRGTALPAEEDSHGPGGAPHVRIS